MENKASMNSFSNWITRVIRTRLAAFLVLVVSVLVAIAMGMTAGPAQLINVIVTGGMWALLATGLALIFGVMNIATFAHGESFMLGAFVGYFAFTAINKFIKANPSQILTMLAPIISILAAGGFGVFLGAVIERLTIAPLRKRTRVAWVMNCFLLTTGISFILRDGTNLVLGPNYRGVAAYYDLPSVNLFGINVAVDRIFALSVAVVIIGALTWFMQRTKTGRAIRAVSQDETGAEIVGINLSSIHTLTFSMATAMAAIAGATMIFMFQAYPSVGIQPNYYSWYVVMLVGLGNVYGAIIGGFIVALLQTATQQYFGIAWMDVVPTVLMIIILIVVPSGIFGSEVKGILEE